MAGFKSDGNGGYNIQKGTFAAITLFIMLMSIVGTVIAYGVTIKTDVEHLKTVYYDTADKTDDNKNAIIQNQERIISMHDDIKEIKLDVKEIIKR